MAKLFIIVASFIFISCAEQDAAPPLPPPDLTSRQAKLFQASCALCHAAANSGAPQVGDDIWEEYWAQGFDVLMKNAIEGTEGMPPLGGCYGCSRKDLEALIQFLAQRGIKRSKNE